MSRSTLQLMTAGHDIGPHAVRPRVLHVTPYMEATAGGPPVVVAQLLAHADENNYDAGVLTTPALTPDGGAGLRGVHPGITLIPSQPAAWYGAGARAVEAAVAQADILHLHTMWSPLVARAALVARRKGIPYILSPHGMLDPYSIGQKRLKKQIYLALLERGTIRGAARILFTAPEERDLAAPVTGPVPSTVIGLGADLPPEAPKTLRARFNAAYPDLAHRPRAIFMGRLHDKKRPASAVLAMAKLRKTQPDAVLLLVGAGEEDPRLHALVAEHALEDQVRFLGFLTGTPKWEALCAADIFLLPSRQENFGIALAEAMHAGVPALITDKINIWREMTEAGAARLLNEGQLETSLADQMDHWLCHPDARRNASLAARDYAAEHFTWAGTAEITHTLYTAVLCDAPGNSA